MVAKSQYKQIWQSSGIITTAVSSQIFNRKRTLRHYSLLVWYSCTHDDGTTDGNQDAPVNTLKEAMAMGMPVIGTLHGGIPELIEDGVSGFLVPERDVEKLAEKLLWLIEHPLNWVSMGKAGRAYVEKHYDTNQLNDRLVEIYHQILI